MRKDITTFDGIPLYKIIENSGYENITYYVPGTTGVIEKTIDIVYGTHECLLDKNYQDEARATADKILSMNENEYKALIKALLVKVQSIINNRLLIM